MCNRFLLVRQASPDQTPRGAPNSGAGELICRGAQIVRSIAGPKIGFDDMTQNDIQISWRYASAKAFLARQ
jgi:hypothetical protein